MSGAKMYTRALIGAGADYRLGLSMLGNPVPVLVRAGLVKMKAAGQVVDVPTAAMRAKFKEGSGG